MSAKAKVKSKYLTKSEYPTIGALSEAQIIELGRKTPASEQVVKVDQTTGQTRKGVKASFIEKKLNMVFGWNWNFEIISKEEFKEAKQVVVHGRLTIVTEKAAIYKEQFGTFEVEYFQKKDRTGRAYKVSNIGDALKSAATDALKKCASKFGICWDIYSPEEEKEVPATEEAPIPEVVELTHQEQVVYDRLVKFSEAANNKKELNKMFCNALKSFKKDKIPAQFMELRAEQERRFKDE